MGLSEHHVLGFINYKIFFSSMILKLTILSLLYLYGMWVLP